MDDSKIIDEEARLAALRRYDIRGAGDAKPFQRIVDLVQQVMGVPMAAVSLIESDRQIFKATRGLNGVAEGPRADAFCHYTIAQQAPFAVQDARLDARFAGHPMVSGEPNIRSYLGVPLTTPDGYNVGSLCALDDEPRQFDRTQGEILRKLAEIVVEHFELQQIAKQDSLTGALTRRGFYAEVEKEFLRAQRYERPSTLVAIDVDHFKSVNDRFGHPAGDAVLVSIANACMSNMRRSDIFGRLGGEEFALLLPETDAQEARDAAERIRAAVESTIVQVGGAEIRVTVSLGVAPMPGPGETVSTWFNEADIALYEAKQFGRNRVTVVKPRRPAPPPTADGEPAPHQLH
ncbi:MAG TPA: sensor domain-containing diguanylate cyclase [Devosia sp.]|jgi:diguanylate cyclase (GGDEF)-like protein|nr:sensor domain-containing diguanylate cyclase [Devosia sp.]